MSTTLNLSVIQPRMMSLKQAAGYLQLPIKGFSSVCPVAPVAMPGNALLYDVRDLDRWVDQIKASSGAADNDGLERLKKGAR